jgi:hypothetical protein
VPNLTLSLDEELLHAAKVYAATHRTSISRIVREHLRELTEGSAQADPARDDPVSAFAAMRIGRQEAMRLLGIDYGRLLDRLAARGLDLPRLPDEETSAMADAFVHVWRNADDT